MDIEEEKFTYTNFLLFVTVITVLFNIEGQIFDVTGLHDGCAIDRDSADPSQLPSKWLSEFLLWGTKLALLAIFVQLYLFSRDARHGNIRWKSIKIPITIIWEMTSYSLLHFLRVYIGDFKCHTKANSISGHYWFYLFYIFGALFLIVDLKRSTQYFEHFVSPHIVRRIMKGGLRRQAMFLVATYLLFVTGALLTLYRTWAYGFHTQAQIQYGIFFAVATHYLMIKIMDWSIEEHNKRVSKQAIVFLAVSQIVVFTIDTLYTQVLPWDYYSIAMNICAWVWIFV